MNAPKLASTTVVAEGGAVVRLSGTIDADFDPADLVAAAGILVVDLDGVTRITSFGVREWIRALHKVVADTLVFINARPRIVSQFNMVQGFAHSGVLLSMYLPYICEACETETELHVEVAKHHADFTAGKVPPVACPKCGAACELDDSPRSYFRYVAAQPPPVMSEAVRRVIAGETAAQGEPLEVEKEVDGGVTGLFLRGKLDGRARLKRAMDGLEGLVVVVCSGISGVDDAGVARLLPVLETPEAEVYLARVRTSLIRPIPKGQLALLVGRVASFLMPLRCPKCGPDARAEVRANDPVGADGSRAFRCARCGHSGRMAFDGPREDALRMFLSLRVPPELQRFLDDRPGDAGHPVISEESRGTPLAPGGTPAQPAKYRPLRRIGQGGMAEVFLAQQTGLAGFEKRVVLKRILPALAANGDFVRMFLQEARTAARLNHPNVVQIFDLGKEGATYFMAMEYVKGWDLRTILAAAHALARPLPVEIACRIAADILGGLHAAHTSIDDAGVVSPIIHRDVSPHNVLVSVEGAVKISDFGIAKAQGSSVETRSGVVKGKVMYMAPEQIDPSLGPVDAQSDVFSATLVLYEMLTGTAPFRRDSETSTMHAVLSAQIPPVRNHRGDVDHVLARIIDRGFARDRAARYATARDMHDDLEAFLAASGLAATASHLAAWLEEVSLKMHGSEGLPGPGFTPTGLTPDALDIDVGERGANTVDDTVVVDRAKRKRDA